MLNRPFPEIQLSKTEFGAQQSPIKGEFQQMHQVVMKPDNKCLRGLSAAVQGEVNVSLTKCEVLSQYNP